MVWCLGWCFVYPMSRCTYEEYWHTLSVFLYFSSHNYSPETVSMNSEINYQVSNKCHRYF